MSYGNKLLESNMTTNSYIPEEEETPYSIKINVNVDNHTSNVSSDHFGGALCHAEVGNQQPAGIVYLDSDLDLRAFDAHRDKR